MRESLGISRGHSQGKGGHGVEHPGYESFFRSFRMTLADFFKRFKAFALTDSKFHDLTEDRGKT
jgi:hypothetical protein